MTGLPSVERAKIAAMRAGTAATSTRLKLQGKPQTLNSTPAPRVLNCDILAASGASGVLHHSCPGLDSDHLLASGRYTGLDDGEVSFPSTTSIPWFRQISILPIYPPFREYGQLILEHSCRYLMSSSAQTCATNMITRSSFR